MNLLLVRDQLNPTCTIGKLYVDKLFECFTLEDTDRKLECSGNKIYGCTAIPRGSYKVTLTQSARFGRVLPLVNDVPQFEGIRIHPGNTDKDTDGCVLVGTTVGNNSIGNSRIAFAKLFEKLEAAVAAKEEITLEVR